MITRVSFVAGDDGPWDVTGIRAVRGAPLAPAARLRRLEGADFHQGPSVWQLDGVRSYERYLRRAERDQLVAVQEEPGRLTDTVAILVPIAKSDAWWQLPHDERRAILEDDSHHIALGLRALPAIARRLYHARDLGGPWDFLTWFELAPADEATFDELLATLRATREWDYVAREVEVRLRQASTP